MDHRQIAGQITYAGSAGSRLDRTLVRLMENAGGRLGLIRRARGYETELAQGRDFWEVMCDRYGIGLRVTGGSLDEIPRHGSLVVVANHPYGILDGLALPFGKGRQLGGRAQPIRVLARRGLGIVHGGLRRAVRLGARCQTARPTATTGSTPPMTARSA